MRIDPKSRRWIVEFQYCERKFQSESMPRDIAEQVQDAIEKDALVTAWLVDVGATNDALDAVAARRNENT
jgi:hypothetical protein